MVKKALVNEIQKILKEIEQEKGKFSLVILALMKERWRKRWRFTAAAPWIDEIGRPEAIGYLHQKLFANPDPDYLNSFEDANAFYTDDPLIREILEEYGTDYESPLIINGRTFAQIEFEEIILL